MKLKLLSYYLDPNTPVYGNTPKPEITTYTSQDKGNSSNTYMIKLCNHSGTHIDAPIHFIKGGKSISEYSVNDLVFHTPILVHLPKEAGKWIEKEDVENLQLKDADCVLFRTGFNKLRREEVYRTDNPGISPDAIIFIRKNFSKIRCLGIDTISVSGFQNRIRGREAHKAAFKEEPNLGDPLLLIEDMDLSSLTDNENITKLLVIPWLIQGIDSAPCTVLAEVV